MTFPDENRMREFWQTVKNKIDSLIPSITTAQQTANNAASAASQAQSSANNAKSAADNAQQTANAAKATAEAALPKSGGAMTSEINFADYSWGYSPGITWNKNSVANLFIASTGDRVQLAAVSTLWQPSKSDLVEFSGIKTPTLNYSAANKLYVDSSIVRPNLLINSYWAQKSRIVNQRGENSYTNAKYGIDKWGAENGTVVINENSLSITINDIYTGFIYPIEPLPAGTYTFSFLTDAQDSLYIEAGTQFITNVIDNGLLSGTFTVDDENNIQNVRITSLSNSPVTFHAYAAKLEKGDWQTLARKQGNTWVLNEIPDYATELLKCQRYYFKENDATYFTESFIKENYIIANLIFPARMRETPTITIYSINNDGVRTNNRFTSPYTGETDSAYTITQQQNSTSSFGAKTFRIDPKPTGSIWGIFGVECSADL